MEPFMSGEPHRPDPALLAAIVEDGIGRYFAERRARIEPFVAETFGWRGAWAVNKKALGLDIVRAPVNAALVAPTMALAAARAVARRTGHERLARAIPERELHLKTDVMREIEWRLYRDFLELPFEQPESGRATSRDALAEAILADPRLMTVWQQIADAASRRIDDPALRARLEAALATYQTTRSAASELAGLGLALAAGALIAHQLTPGLLALGTAVAQSAAHQIAVASFPLGSAAAKLWYGIVPVPAAAGASATAALAALGAILTVTALSGAVLDPLQVKLGLHQRRLSRMIDVLEENFLGNTAARYHVRDHYLARLLDLIDAAAAVWAIR